MTDKVVGIDAGKKKVAYEKYNLEVTYLDLTSEQIQCTYFGTSYDNPNFMVFTTAPPDEGGVYPDTLINSDKILKIKLISIEEVTE